jgi:hypothetical protein
MAKKDPEIVKISDITTFGNRLAIAIRVKLGSITKNLRNKKGLVVLTKGQSKQGRAEITISIDTSLRDPKSPTQSISGLIGALEYGAKPHVITPRTAPGLAFKWPKANVDALRGSLYRATYTKKGTFRKNPRQTKFKGFASGGRLAFNWVDHPGMTGYHPIRQALRETRAQATDELRARLKKNVIDSLNFTIREVNKRK